jgi:hypothetical protein
MSDLLSNARKTIGKTCAVGSFCRVAAAGIDPAMEH